MACGETHSQSMEEHASHMNSVRHSVQKHWPSPGETGVRHVGRPNSLSMEECASELAVRHSVQKHWPSEKQEVIQSGLRPLNSATLSAFSPLSVSAQCVKKSGS